MLTRASPRVPAHTRTLVFQGYARDDGLWDIEASLLDVKHYRFTADRGVLEPGDPVHSMVLRITIDNTLTIRSIEASMNVAPFAECQAVRPALQKMVGAQMGPGWRRAIEQALGGVAGCTHLRELLFNAATAAYQTVPHYQEIRRKTAGLPPLESYEPPYHMGKCLAWDFDGPVVRRIAPQFAGRKRATTPEDR
ncbi:MAG: DUF2889 domain-containing protein [Cupriavidus necator]